jgi:hypothetical protein
VRVPIEVLGFHPREPRFDLGPPKSQVPSDPASCWSPSLAPQGVERLDADVQLEGKLLERECRLEGAVDHNAVVGSRGGFL